MIKNNNQKVISRMAGRSLNNNRRRSMIMIMAVALATFMLFSVFTVGITYFKMQKTQNIRLNGGEFDAILYGLTKEQEAVCEKNPDIKETGAVVICGYVEETEKDKTPNVGLVWADDSYWNQIKRPAVKWVKGKYPTKENEVMASVDALKECGLENLEIGDSFRMKYADKNGSYTKEFRISGMWEDYGDTDTFYMSKAYFEQSGYELHDVRSTRYYLDFEKKYMPKKEQDAFLASMELEKQQNLFFLSDYSNALEILMGMIGLVLITCFSAYLLIYNILYLSVSGNVRYYGLLQTVGMTGRQIHRFMHRQMIFIASIGMTAGLAAGSLVAFFLIPTVVKALGIREAVIEVRFHPLVFLLTILLTGVTIYMGSRKPAKLAVSISPVEALGYRVQTGKKSMRKTGNGNLILRMAKEQLALQSKTVYHPEEKRYEYKPRGLEEVEYPEYPYPEVTEYKKNANGTLTLKVNTVFPYRGISKVYTHEVTVRDTSGGEIQYVANRIVEPMKDQDIEWHKPRLTRAEWEAQYGGK